MLHPSSQRRRLPGSPFWWVPGDRLSLMIASPRVAPALADAHTPGRGPCVHLPFVYGARKNGRVALCFTNT